MQEAKTTNNSNKRRAVLPARLSCILILLVAALTGCRDEQDFDFLPAVPGSATTGLPAGAIEVSPFDQTLDLSTWAVDTTVAEAVPVTDVRLVTPEADFVMPLGTDRLYVEQNDDAQWRTATIAVTHADGTTRTLTLAQPPATRASTDEAHRSFYRHFGVGYSYDAVGGEYCNPNYIRCQLLNRAVLDEVDEIEGIRYPMLFLEYYHQMERSHSLFTSLTDYVQNSNFDASLSAELIIINGALTANIYAFEEGLVEQYILRDEISRPCMRYTLQTRNVAKLIDKYPNLLTSSFRKALDKLSKTASDDWQAVDEFLEVYGSHIVCDVKLGAKLVLDLQVDTHKYLTEVEQGVKAEADLACIFEIHFKQEQKDRNYELARNCKCRLDVIGGDISILDGIIGMTTFAEENIHVEEGDLNRWMASIYFDDDDLEHTNVELIDMQLVPIWDLVPDKTLKDRIKTRVYSNAAIMQRLLGNRNFVNVKIPYSTTKYVCRVGDKKYTFTDPGVSDVVVGGRYVATICSETVPPIDKNKKVRVVYPIYEGHVKLSSGLCVYNNNVYKVNWMPDSLEVVNAGLASDFDGNIYMTSGVLTAQRLEAVEYNEGHLVAGLERPGGIGIDGSLQGTPVSVVKHFNHFYLNKKDRYDNLPNWSYVTEEPSEAKLYPQYFDGSTWKDRMRRNDDYVYILNNTELGYE